MVSVKRDMEGRIVSVLEIEDSPCCLPARIDLVDETKNSIRLTLLSRFKRGKPIQLELDASSVTEFDYSDEERCVEQFKSLMEVGHLLDDRDGLIFEFEQNLKAAGYATWKISQMRNYAAACSSWNQV